MIMNHLCLRTILFIALLTTSVIAQDSPAAKSFTYKTTKQGELTLKAYFPAAWHSEEKRPAIVFFFGGGWTNGTPAQFEPQAKYLADRGMVAFCADYRVKARHGVSPEVCVEDAKSAIRWVRQNAAKLGIDPNKIVGSGGSAGGHIAACTALCPGFDNQEENQAISSKPNVLLLFNPVLNFNVADLQKRVGDDAVLAKAISPTQHLAKASPPTLLFFGKEDRLLTQGEEFMQRSKELGLRAEIFLADGVGHGFFNKSPWLATTIKRADEFLVALGYLQAIPATPRSP